MEIKNFSSFNESLYSMAASIAPSNYSKPVRNDEYIVKGVVIEFPDTTQLLFEVVREDYFSDKINYKISVPRNENPLWHISRDYKHTPQNTIQQFYIDVFGDSIQMENYQEFVFVRCWNTEEDFIENEWEGFIFKSDSDGGFYEIKMKFIIISNPLKQNLRYTPEYFKNSYLDKNTAMWAIRHFYQELPNGIKYSDLMILKRKFESYLINIDETKSIVNLRETKVEGTSLLSLIYALSLRDNNILKNLKLTSNNINQCPTNKLLDTLF